MQDQPAIPAHQHIEAIALARLRFLYGGLPLSLLITVILCLTTTLVLQRQRPAAVLLGWLIAMLLVCSARGLDYWSYRRSAHAHTLDWAHWRMRFVMGAFVAGSGWGAGSVVLFPPGLPEQVFLSFLIAGTSAAAVTTMAADRLAVLSFVLPNVIPLAVMLFLQRTSVGYAMGAMGLLYLAVVSVAGSRAHALIISSETLRLEADRHRTALAASELQRRVGDERLRALFEFSPLGIALLNDRNVVLEANPALLRLLDRTAEQVVHHPLGPLLPDLSAHAERADENAVAATGAFGPMEYELPLHDGRSVPVALHGMRIQHPDGEVYRWAFIEDIGTRKAAERQLRALSDRLLLAAQAAQIGVWEFDDASKTLLWDRRMYDIYASDPVLHPDPLALWYSRVHPTFVTKAARAVQTALATRTNLDDEFRVVWPNGEERTVRSAGHVRVDPITHAVRITGVNWDVTDLRRVERLKSEFVATVSHELRTPLTSIRGALSLVNNGVTGPLPEQAQHMLALADRNAERLARLIDDLLDIEKIEAGKLAVDVAVQPLLPLVTQAVQAIGGYANLQGVQVQLEGGDADILVCVDAHRLLQVLANLLSNAAKFSPRGSNVCVRMPRAGPRVRVEVSDRGPGIAPELRSRLFTKFSQGDGSDSRISGGTGLGLAISKALIEQMGGSIGCQSDVQQGSTFFVEFAVDCSRAAVAAPGPAA